MRALEVTSKKFKDNNFPVKEYGDLIRGTDSLLEVETEFIEKLMFLCSFFRDLGDAIVKHYKQRNN